MHSKFLQSTRKKVFKLIAIIFHHMLRAVSPLVVWGKQVGGAWDQDPLWRQMLMELPCIKKPRLQENVTLSFAFHVDLMGYIEPCSGALGDVHLETLHMMYERQKHIWNVKTIILLNWSIYLIGDVLH